MVAVAPAAAGEDGTAADRVVARRHRRDDIGGRHTPGDRQESEQLDRDDTAEDEGQRAVGVIVDEQPPLELVASGAP